MPVGVFGYPAHGRLSAKVSLGRICVLATYPRSRLEDEYDANVMWVWLDVANVPRKLDSYHQHHGADGALQNYP